MFVCLLKFLFWDLECVIYGGIFLDLGREVDLGREDVLGGIIWFCKYNNIVYSIVY